jgi:ParB-like chromosome segregation protein Spo0J
MTAPEPQCHPACLLLPEMGEAEYRELVEDIRQHGQQQNIIVDEHGVILDGRHRWRACQELGIQPWLTRRPGLSEVEKVALVMCLNIHRRHLTTDQRAALAAELATMKSGTRTDLASIGARSPGLSDAQASKVMGVSERTVERAKRRMRADPEAHAKAKAGTLGRKQPQSKPQKMRRQWDAMRKPVDGDVEPKPKARLDPRDVINQLLMAIPKNFDAAAWAAELPSFLRKNTASSIKDLRGRLLVLETVLTGADRILEPEPALAPPEPATPELAEEMADAMPQEPVEGLLAPSAAVVAARSATHPAPDALRERLRAALDSLRMSETRFAKHAGIPQPSLNRFMLGQGGTSRANRAKIEAALAELAAYAEARP